MLPIYLDHNATGLILPESADAIYRCQLAGLANPASQHAAGRRARQVLDDARESIARLLGAEIESGGGRMIFTSGGTEANNLAVLGLAAGPPRRILISSIEHPSVVGAAAELARRGWTIDRAGVDRRGVVDVDQFRSLISSDTRLASVMLANNETGAIQPVAVLAAICRREGVPLHTDASQAAGKLSLDFRELGVAAMTVAAHKFHGPIGIGTLILRPGIETIPQIHGGVQQLAIRPGTESVALAVGMEAALAAWETNRATWVERIAGLRDRFEEGLRAAWPKVVIHAAMANRLPHVTNAAFVGRERQSLLMALDLAGVCCSTGSACASGSTDPSPTLVAMGCHGEQIDSSLRFSLGPQTTAEEIDQAVARIREVLVRKV